MIIRLFFGSVLLDDEINKDAIEWYVARMRRWEIHKVLVT